MRFDTGWATLYKVRITVIERISVAASTYGTKSMSVENAAIEPWPKSRCCIIVAGMHRSGTSAITRVVNLLGADIARDMLPARPGDNDRGYWESTAVVDIHDQLLRALGLSFDDPSPLPERWLESSFARDAQRRLTEEIAKDFGGSGIFVVKDPRIARLLPLWLDLLDKLAIKSAVIIPVRNPLEVATSLKRRDEYSVPNQTQAMLLYVRSYLETELASRGRKRLFVPYEQLLSNWALFATKLRNLVGSKVLWHTNSNEAEISNFLTVDLHRNRANRDQLAETPEISATVVEMYDLMTKVADNGDEKLLRPAFDRLGKTASEATKLFHGLILAERDKAQAQVTRLRQDNWASEGRATDEKARLQLELESARARAADLETALANELAGTRSQVTELETELETQSSQMAVMRDQSIAMREEMARLNSELEKRSGELETARLQVQDLEVVAETRAAAAARLSGELTEARHRVSQAALTLESQKNELDAIKRTSIWRLTTPFRLVGEKLPWIPRRWRLSLQLSWRTFTLQLGSIRHGLQTLSGLQAIEASELFDRRYYLEHYPDVRASGVDPVLHYLLHGGVEGRIPTPNFDGAMYLERNPDVRRSGANPLVHYLRYGALEGRDPNGWFDSDFYLNCNPDVRSAGMNPLVHYLRHGVTERRDPNPLQRQNPYLDGITDIRAPESLQLDNFARGHQPMLPFGEAQAEVAPQTLQPADTDQRIANSIQRFRFQQAESKLSYRPLISILMPTYNTPEIFLEAAVRSVIEQTYHNWELRIVDDGSTDPATLEILNLLESRDARIHVTGTPDNRGIARATNAALACASGDFVAMLDHDDELTADALFEIVRVLNVDPTTDAIYTDQDYVSPEGAADGHLLKPDWSPERLRGVMYVGHLLTVRRALAIDVGGFNPRFDFVQDFEFMLRLSERTRNIRHVPKVLYHWRRAPQSVAGGGKAEKGIELLQAAAVQAHLDRLGIIGTAKPNTSHPHRAVIQPANVSVPAIDVLIVGSDVGPMQSNIFESFARACGSRSELWMAEEMAAQVACRGKPRVIPGVGLSQAALVSRVLLEGNNDFVLVVSAGLASGLDGWISWLARPMEESDVACVCPLVCSADGRVAHAGLVIERNGRPRSAWSGADPAADGYAGSMSCAREVSAAWGEAVLLRRAAALSVLTDDTPYWTSDFLVADITLRCTKKGLRVICVPQARVQRPTSLEVDEWRRLDELLFCDAWGEEARRGDPFRNPNFSSTELCD